MMIKTLDQIQATDLDMVGGKSMSLARLHQNNFPVPKTVCLTTRLYETFIASSGLRTRIQMEMNRKEFNEMRLEEIWDASLRLRNLFLRTPIPADIVDKLHHSLSPVFADTVVAVRSSAPAEDARGWYLSLR